MNLTNVRSATIGPSVSSAANLKIVRSNSTAPEAESRAGPISREGVKELVESLHESMDVLQTKLSFSISEETDQIIVEVTNRETDELIRQIPPEELVALRAKMDELVGILFDKRV